MERQLHHRDTSGGPMALFKALFRALTTRNLSLLGIQNHALQDNPDTCETTRQAGSPGGVCVRTVAFGVADPPAFRPVVSPGP